MNRHAVQQHCSQRRARHRRLDAASAQPAGVAFGPAVRA